MRRKLDLKAKDARRLNGINGLMQRGQKLCLNQGSDFEMLLVVVYRTKRKLLPDRCIYTGQGEMLERFCQGEVIQPDVSLLKAKKPLKSHVPTTAPTVEELPGSGACLAEEQLNRMHGEQTVQDITTCTMRSGMLMVKNITCELRVTTMYLAKDRDGNISLGLPVAPWSNCKQVYTPQGVPVCRWREL